MSSEQTTPALGEEEAREIINRWANAGFFRLKNMGDKIFVEQITPGAAYTICLQTHVEQRQVQQATQPYHGGAVDNRGRAPDRWEVPVAKPGPFEERSQTVPVPHTERVQMCGACAGQGRTSCSLCMGQGRIRCPTCMGLGFIEQQIFDPVQQTENAAITSRTVRRGCTCSGGQVVCSGCAGNGLVRCSSCAGSGQVKTFDQLVVRFLTATQGEVIDVTPVPDNWLGRLSGEVLSDLKEQWIERCEVVPETVAQKANELLAQSHVIDEKQERILLQLVHIERLPLQEVHYQYAGVDRQLWICGAEQAIHAPNAPWNRQRLFGLIAGILAGVMIVGGLILYLVT
jgi:hypothetical protein